MYSENLSKLIGRPAETTSLPVRGSYPQEFLIWEVLKGVAGGAICLAILVVLQPSPWLGWPLVGVMVLFLLYFLQQARRFSYSLEVDDLGLTRVQGGRRKVFRWEDLRQFRLNYYPHGRKSSKGTLVVVLAYDPDGRQEGAGKVKVDSTLDHFPTLLSRAAQAARERDLELHPSTVANMQQLGV